MTATLRMVLGSSMRWSPSGVGAELTPTRTCWAATALLLSFAASAQQADWATAEAPAESYALQDDGTSLGGNPAGLAFSRGLELNYLHNGFRQTGTTGHTEALYGTLGSGVLTAGLGADWLSRSRQIVCIAAP